MRIEIKAKFNQQFYHILICEQKYKTRKCGKIRKLSPSTSNDSSKQIKKEWTLTNWSPTHEMKLRFKYEEQNELN